MASLWGKHFISPGLLKKRDSAVSKSVGLTSAGHQFYCRCLISCFSFAEEDAGGHTCAMQSRRRNVRLILNHMPHTHPASLSPSSPEPKRTKLWNLCFTRHYVALAAEGLWGNSTAYRAPVASVEKKPLRAIWFFLPCCIIRRPLPFSLLFNNDIIDMEIKYRKALPPLIKWSWHNWCYYYYYYCLIYWPSASSNDLMYASFANNVYPLHRPIAMLSTQSLELFKARCLVVHETLSSISKTPSA